MSGPVVHTELTMSLDRFPLPAQNQAALDVSFGDPIRNFTDGVAAMQGPSSCHLLPQKDRVTQDLGAACGNQNAHSSAHASCLAYSHSVSAFTNGKSQADCAGFSCAVALSEGIQAHSSPGNEGCMYPQHFSFRDSAMACMACYEEGVHTLHTSQGDVTEWYGCKENHTSMHETLRVGCTGSAHGPTNCPDPCAPLSTASVKSCEDSASLHEEGGDSIAPQESYENLTPLPAGCGDTEDFGHVQRVRGASANGYDCVQDSLEEVLDPYLQQADTDTTSSCSSKCSSAISMVSDASAEITSRQDSQHKNIDARESYWTDAKHGSYLDYMEASFVKNLYGRAYCTLDVCGQQPFHQALQNSSTWLSTQLEFKSWQSGDWHRRSMLKPPMRTCIPLALRPSPWVNHFRHRKVSRARQQIRVEDLCTFCGVNEGEEVNSPSFEVCREALEHDHANGSRFGDPDISRCGNTPKRRHESNLEQVQARQVLEKNMCR